MRSASKVLILTAAALGLALLTSPAHANVITPGTTANPDVFATNPLTSGTIVANTGVQNYSAAQNGNSITGTAQNWVVSGYAGNPYGANDLTFVYQVSLTGGTNNSNTAVILERVTGAGFDTVFSTDAGYNTASGQVAPITVDRSQNGNVVGFNFIPPGSNITVGQSSYLLIVATNATNYIAQSMSVQDGVSANANAYGPQVPPTIPEPTTMVLAGLGTLGFTGYGLRRRKARSA
jgi:hypothetical protein